MHSTFALRAMRSIHPASASLSSAAFRAPMMAAAARPAVGSLASTRVGTGMAMSPGMQLAKRWNTQENKGGRAKLIFRFGLRDIPVELYPMAFVVAVACVGAAFAVGRHFYLDGLRTGPAGKTATTE